MTPPPSGGPDCPRLRRTPPRDPVGAIALALAIYMLPFLAGASGSIAFAREALGPLVTLTVWIILLVATTIRRQRFATAECLPVIGCIVVLQLLLDLHTPHLGDLVVAVLHAVVICLLAVINLIQGRRAR